jgi:hypothetical protein
MVTFTVNQWAILFLVLVLGWLLGMMSRSGGARWRAAAAEERAARERVESERDAARARIAELERDRPAVVERPVVAGDRAVTEEQVVAETTAERRAERAERRAERAEDRARADRAAARDVDIP